jgi:hypothetical protein
MTPELEKYYNNYFSLFLTEGWRQFIEEAKESREALDLDSCKDWDSFLVRKTMRDQLNKIINFESLMKDSHDRMTSSESEDLNDTL